MIKKCGNSKCALSKPIECFGKNKRSKDGFDYRCKECRVKSMKEYTLNHRHERLAYNKEYKRKNRDVISEYNKKYLKKYYIDNREDIIKVTSQNTTERRRNDPKTRLASNLRRRIHHAIKGKRKSIKTLSTIGCTIMELMSWLSMKFVSGMTWENYGKVWHVDHVKPLISFDLTKESELLRANNYTNLQPLFALDNIRKSDHY